ncbi:MAG TPA: hypothetical protein VML00_08925 [Bacteroidota bacterium]|nr:hypothetical protein [Bacteroidota bacterium]
MHARATHFARIWILLLLLTGGGGRCAVAQKLPGTFREFLAQQSGKEILLVTMLSDSLQYDDADSTERYVVVLDGVSGDFFTVHRTAQGDHRSFVFPIADIRRITYLWGGRPYRRVLVETF